MAVIFLFVHFYTFLLSLKALIVKPIYLSSFCAYCIGNALAMNQLSQKLCTFDSEINLDFYGGSYQVGR